MDASGAHSTCAGHITTLGFPSRPVGKPEGISPESPDFWLLWESGKIEPPAHLLQGDSACAQEGFSDQEEKCYWPLALGAPWGSVGACLGPPRGVSQKVMREKGQSRVFPAL